MDLHEVGEHMSDAMFKAIVLKGLPKEYDNILTLFNHGEEKEHGGEAVKLDLVYSANNRSVGGQNSAFMSGGGNKPKCSNCKRSGHTDTDCRQAKDRSSATIAGSRDTWRRSVDRRHRSRSVDTATRWVTPMTSAGRSIVGDRAVVNDNHRHRASSQPASTRIHSGSVSWRQTTGVETRPCGILD